MSAGMTGVDFGAAAGTSGVAGTTLGLDGAFVGAVEAAEPGATGVGWWASCSDPLD